MIILTHTVRQRVTTQTERGYEMTFDEIMKCAKGDYLKAKEMVAEMYDYGFHNPFVTDVFFHKCYAKKYNRALKITPKLPA